MNKRRDIGWGGDDKGGFCLQPCIHPGVGKKLLRVFSVKEKCGGVQILKPLSGRLWL